MTDSEREHQAPDPYSHEPVMVREILDAFAPIAGGVVLDATVGGGGHARAILEAHDDVTLVGLDRDDDALAAAADALAAFGDRVVLRRSSFDRLSHECHALGIDLAPRREPRHCISFLSTTGTGHAARVDFQGSMGYGW